MIKKIQYLVPDSEFVLIGNTYEGLEWLDERPKPTLEEIEAVSDEEVELAQWRQTAKLPSRKFWLGVEFYPWNGGFMLDAINDAIKSLKGKQIKKIQIELDKTHEFNRNAPSTLMMIQAIGMTPEQADEFFRWADNEEWDNE
jgi:hypothetical protein